MAITCNNANNSNNTSSNNSNDNTSAFTWWSWSSSSLPLTTIITPNSLWISPLHISLLENTRYDADWRIRSVGHCGVLILARRVNDYSNNHFHHQYPLWFVSFFPFCNGLDVESPTFYHNVEDEEEVVVRRDTEMRWDGYFPSKKRDCEKFKSEKKNQNGPFWDQTHITSIHTSTFVLKWRLPNPPPPTPPVSSTHDVISNLHISSTLSTLQRDVKLLPMVFHSGHHHSKISTLSTNGMCFPGDYSRHHIPPSALGNNLHWFMTKGVILLRL